MVAFGVLAAADALVLLAIARILADEHEFDRLAGIRIDDGIVGRQGSLSDYIHRMPTDDAVDIQPCGGRGGAGERQQCDDDRCDRRPHAVLHAIPEAMARFDVTQTVDVRKLIAGMGLCHGIAFLVIFPKQARLNYAIRTYHLTTMELYVPSLIFTDL